MYLYALKFDRFVKDFCNDHVKLQLICQILESNKLPDLFSTVKTMFVRVTSKDITIRTEKNEFLIQGWYSSGKQEFYRELKDGENHGVYREYNPSGIMWLEEYYLNGKLHGVSKELLESGIVYAELFSNGVSLGRVNSWAAYGV